MSYHYKIESMGKIGIFKLFVCLCGCAWSYLWHMESLAATVRLLAVACGIQFPNQDLNPRPHALGVFITGLPRMGILHSTCMCVS